MIASRSLVYLVQLRVRGGHQPRASRASKVLRMNTYKAEVERRRSVPAKATTMTPQGEALPWCNKS
jgi:hypothetical protein